ncbi:MAG: hypothetical protein ABFQ53_00670, partial [Patescibacteria group bacterium]
IELPVSDNDEESCTPTTTVEAATWFLGTDIVKPDVKKPEKPSILMTVLTSVIIPNGINVGAGGD